jgi:hypothetical protein
VFLKVPPLTNTKLSGTSPEQAIATAIMIAVKMNSFLIELPRSTIIQIKVSQSFFDIQNAGPAAVRPPARRYQMICRWIITTPLR